MARVPVVVYGYREKMCRVRNECGERWVVSPKSERPFRPWGRLSA